MCIAASDAQPELMYVGITERMCGNIYSCWTIKICIEVEQDSVGWGVEVWILGSGDTVRVLSSADTVPERCECQGKINLRFYRFSGNPFVDLCCVRANPGEWGGLQVSREFWIVETHCTLLPFSYIMTDLRANGTSRLRVDIWSRARRVFLSFPAIPIR